VSRGLQPAVPGDAGAAAAAPVTAAPVTAAAPAAAYCEVSGPASVLYLLLWNRGPAAGLDVRGDASVLAMWRERMRVRWR
jgi:hypothetical protein